MELEEMKNKWQSLEEQLKKQEIINEKLILEVRQSKSGPLRQLINHNVLCIVLGILAIPLFIYVYNQSYYGTFKTLLFCFAGLIVLSAIIMGVYNLLQLIKVDFTQSVRDNVRLVHTYKINIKKQYMVSFVVVSVFIVLCIIASFLSANMEVWRWILIGIFIILGIILGIWEYKKMHKAKSNAILKSLEELKELE